MRARTPARLAPAAPAVGTEAARSVPATVGLTALTLVSAAGMGALFRTGPWRGPVLGAVVVAHVVLWAARRRSLPQPVGALAAFVAVGLLACWTLLPHTTVLGLPTGRTVSTMTADLRDARRAFSQLVPPVPALPGFVMVAMAGMAVVAALADWAAFRLQAPLEGLVPALATLVFVGLLARGGRGLGWAAAFVAAACWYLLTHRAGTIRAGPRLSGGGIPLVTRAGVVLTGVAVGAAVVVGPHLPGARSPALVDVHSSGNTGPSHRTTISPLVDIRTRLVQESNVELFTVRSAAPEYWRVTSLDRFDGEIWSSDDSYSSLGGSAVPSPLPAASTVRVDQGYTIAGLGSIWLPAAYLPVSVTGARGVSWDERSDSLISAAATSDGLRYGVVSAVPQFTAGELRTAGGEATAGPFTALPPIPPDVARLAARITAGASTAYDKARALQDYLRNHFTYSLSVPPGHSNSALEEFLFVTRRGYCEQFAGAYAVMARSVGLPTRVAVGFTPGATAPDGLWHVYGMYAHAWPEVLLGRFGWVAFDPTPGRGIPGSSAYTGLPAEQASSSGAGGTTPVPATPSTTPTTAGTGAQAPTTTAAPTRPPASPGAGRHHLARGSFPWRAIAALAAAAALVGLWLVGVPAAKAARRNRRRRRAADDAERILVAWEEAAERLSAAGLARAPTETFGEHADRLRGGLPGGAAQALGGLAEQAAGAAYGRREPEPGAVAVAYDRAAAVETAVLERAGRWRRLAWEADPRPRSWAGRPSRRGGS